MSLKKIPAQKSKKLSQPFLLIGKPQEVLKIKKSLKSLKVRWEESTWDQIDIKDLNKEYLGVLFVDLHASPLLESAIKSIQKVIPNKYPIFAVVSDQTPDLKVRNIYELGTTAVFEWPLESLILGRLLSELLGMELIHGRPKKGDAALVHSIRAHLRLMKEVTSDIKINVSHGMVTLSGTVGSLPKKNRIEEMLTIIPGVTGVNLKPLIIPPGGISDKVLTRKIKKAVQVTRLVDESTFTFEVQNGYVTLAGTVMGSTELNNLIKIISGIEGIRGYNNLTTVSANQKRKDQNYSTAIQKFIKFLYPQEDVSAKYFGGIAVLTGQVKKLSLKKEIQKDVETRSFVERVVNKIQVK